MQPVILHTKRMELSAPTEADIDQITHICQDEDILKWTTVPSPYSRADAEFFVTQIVQPGWESKSALTWAMRQGGDLIGMISLTALDESMYELGYWMAPVVRGQGLMVEAVQRVADYGFAADGLNLGRIEWHAYVGNAGSASVARRSGFTYEGLLRMEGLQRGKRHDSWVAGLLPTDDRAEKPGWPA